MKIIKLALIATTLVLSSCDSGFFNTKATNFVENSEIGDVWNPPASKNISLQSAHGNIKNFKILIKGAGGSYKLAFIGVKDHKIVSIWISPK